MSSLGSRILAAIALLADPALVTQIQANTQGLAANDANDAQQTALLETLGTTTTQLAADLTSIRESLDAAGVLDAEQAAALDELQETIDSLDAAFPDETQPPAPPVEEPTPEPTPTPEPSGDGSGGTGDGTENLGDGS